MNIRIHFGRLAILPALILPAAGHAALLQSMTIPTGSGDVEVLALGGGRGGGGLGGGGISRPAASRPQVQTGFHGAGSSLNRGDVRPTGGWSSSVQAPSARPSLAKPGIVGSNRPVGGRELGGLQTGEVNAGLNRTDFNRGNVSGSGLNRNDFNRTDFNRSDLNRTVNRSVNRDWTRTVNIGDVTIHPGWARPGWALARPWNYGWYGGWSNPPWGWWGARAAVWGIGALATASVINASVDTAINDEVTYIVVPNTSYQLVYGSVAPSGSSSVTFAVTVDGNTYQLTADCRTGSINGRDPADASEAELLNAACQVAYGSG